MKKNSSSSFQYLIFIAPIQPLMVFILRELSCSDILFVLAVYVSSLQMFQSGSLKIS